MKHRHRSSRHARTGLAIGLALVLAACGGGSQNAEGDTSAGALGTNQAQPVARPSAADRQKQAQQAEKDHADQQSALSKLRGNGVYNIKLSTPSVSERFAEDEGRVRALSATSGEGAAQPAAEALRAQRMAYDRQLAAEQDEIGSRIRALGARVTVQNRAAVNVMTVQATADQAQAIAALPGVAAVEPDRNYKLDLQSKFSGLTSGATSAISTSCNNDRNNPDVKVNFRRASSKAELLAYHDVVAAHAANIKGQGIRVAVLDDGVDYTHAAMGGPGTAAALNRAIANAGAANAGQLATAMFPYPGSKVIGGYDFISNDLSPFPVYQRAGVTVNGISFPCDYVAGHGTHVIDVLQTVAPEARFYAFKVCDLDDCPGSAIIAALNRTLDPDGTGLSRKVDVVSMSLGANGGRLSSLLTEAVNNIAKAGVVVVAAAGNAGPVAHALSTPAVAPKVTAVAEMQGPARKRANGDPENLSIMEYSSSSGPSIDGLAIKPEVGAVGKVLTALAGTGDDVEPFSGTSGATPVVSGVYALLRQRYPSLTPAQLRARLVNTSRPGAVWGSGHTLPAMVFGKAEPDPNDPQGWPRLVTDWSLPAHRVVQATYDQLFGSGPWLNALTNQYMVSGRTPVPAMRLGGGEVHASAALRSPVMVYAVDDSRDVPVPGDTVASYPASANFGKLAVAQPTTLPPKTLWVENFGPTARTLALSATFRDPAKQASGAVTVSFSPATVTVPKDGRVAVTMNLRVDPARLQAANQVRGKSLLAGRVTSDAPGLLHRDFANECGPTDALCLQQDVFDGKVELRDAAETLRLSWQVLPVRSSQIGPQLASASNGQPLLRFTNSGTAQIGSVEVFDWLGHHGKDDARVAQGLLHIRAWGAREVQFDPTPREVAGGTVFGGSRRGIQVVYLLDRNAFFGSGFHPAQVVAGNMVSGLSLLKLGIDVDGDGVCGNQHGLAFKFRDRLPGETQNNYDDARSAAERTFWYAKQRVNTAAQASDALMTIVPTRANNFAPEQSRSQFTYSNALGGIDLLKGDADVAVAGGSGALSQVLRGKHLAEWQASGSLPEVFRTNQRNIGGIEVDYRGGLVVSFIIPIDDSTRWYTNRVLPAVNGMPYVRKPGAPAPVLADGGTRFSTLPEDANIVEGLRLNSNQTTVTLCPVVGDLDRDTDKFYPPKTFKLGGPRFQVQGLTPRNGAVSVGPGAVVTRNLSANGAQHPALGVLVRGVNDQQEISLIAVP